MAKLRGLAYHLTACHRGDFALGAAVRLVPEPDNPHDPNAVAVTADEDEAAAYISKGNAKRWGRLGQPLRVVA